MKECYELIREALINEYGSNYSSNDILEFLLEKIEGGGEVLIEGKDFKSKRITKKNKNNFDNIYPQVIDLWLREKGTKIMDRSVVPDSEKQKYIKIGTALSLNKVDEMNQLYKIVNEKKDLNLIKAIEVANEMFRYVVSLKTFGEDEKSASVKKNLVELNELRKIIKNKLLEGFLPKESLDKLKNIIKNKEELENILKGLIEKREELIIAISAGIDIDNNSKILNSINKRIELIESEIKKLGEKKKDIKAKSKIQSEIFDARMLAKLKKEGVNRDKVAKSISKLVRKSM